MLTAVLGCALVALLYLYGKANVEPIMLGSPVPDISLFTRSGIPVSLEALLSRKALLLFFTVDCPHCITELLHFSALETTRKDSLQFLFVSLSSPDETRHFFSTWRDDLPLVLADPDRTKEALGIIPLPLLLFVDSGGRVVYRRCGERPFEADEHLVHILIAQGPP
jgi:peroxiredoxin